MPDLLPLPPASYFLSKESVLKKKKEERDGKEETWKVSSIKSLDSPPTEGYYLRNSIPRGFGFIVKKKKSELFLAFLCYSMALNINGRHRSNSSSEYKLLLCESRQRFVKGEFQ